MIGIQPMVRGDVSDGQKGSVLSCLFKCMRVRTGRARQVHKLDKENQAAKEQVRRQAHASSAVAAVCTAVHVAHGVHNERSKPARGDDTWPHSLITTLHC